MNRILSTSLASLLAATVAFASPRIDSDSVAQRHSLQLLRDGDAGVSSAVLTWPWPLGRSPFATQETPGDTLAKTLYQLQDLYNAEQQLGLRPLQASVSLASDPLPFRSFGSQPREQFEASLSTSWLSEWLSGNLQLTFAEDPSDGDELRLDGSYLAIALGNWVAAIDQVERWWGPGWDGSLILSNNARPVPALSLTRISPEAFETKWLRWIGPWTFTTFMGQLDNDEGERDGSDARLFGMRIDFSPFGWKNLDIGLSRTAQWAGDGRPGDLDTFWRLLIGEDNRVNGVTLDNEPGNQLAGIDYRLRIPGWRFAQYTQIVGEDEETYTPDANMLLFGIETWGDFETTDASWRAYFEWADTRAGHLIRDNRPNDAMNIAYNHGIYRTGYRFKGSSLGHAMDGDGLMRSIGFMLVNESGDLWGLKLRDYDLNRDGRGPNSVTIDRVKGNAIELVADVALHRWSSLMPFSPKDDSNASPHSAAIRLKAGLHYISNENQRTLQTEDDLGGYLALTREL